MGPKGPGLAQTGAFRFGPNRGPPWPNVKPLEMANFQNPFSHFFQLFSEKAKKVRKRVQKWPKVPLFPLWGQRALVWSTLLAKPGPFGPIEETRELLATFGPFLTVLAVLAVLAKRASFDPGPPF